MSARLLLAHLSFGLNVGRLLTQCRAEASLSEQNRRQAIFASVMRPTLKACLRSSVFVAGSAAMEMTRAINVVDGVLAAR
jgi:hypothetical protein